MSDLLKGLLTVGLPKLLGVGLGWWGTGVRFVLGVASTWAASKGVDVDQKVVTDLTLALIGFGGWALQLLGSYLNNKVIS